MIITKKSDYPAPINTPSGENIQEVLGLQAGDVQSHSLARILIPPGKSSSPHFHKHADESYLILAGTADMHINGVRFSLQPWEAVLIQPGEVHQIFNHGDEDLIFLVGCVPAWQPGDSFEVDTTN